jgi:N-acetylmuramic acid 6-phosphate etherase
MTGLPQTEARNPRSEGLDLLSTPALVELLADEHRAAVDAVVSQRDVIAAVVDEVSARLRAGGRLHYVGAGTSGRLGYLDASEMPPTFGTPRDLVCAHIAGGVEALTRAIEGAEDDGDAGAAEMRDHVAAGDAVIGISASGGAPYVVRAIETARAIGAYTVGVANSEEAPLHRVAQTAIVLRSGPEPLTGSTRLKAGTAQKLLLNTISTAAMVRLGKTFDNLMVDMVATNEKLRGRAQRLVSTITGLDADAARALLGAAAGNVKVASLMGRRGIDAASARALLTERGGSLRACLVE